MQLTAKELKRLIREELVRGKINESALPEETEQDVSEMASMFEASGLTKEDIKNIILEALGAQKSAVARMGKQMGKSKGTARAAQSIDTIKEIAQAIQTFLQGLEQGTPEDKIKALKLLVRNAQEIS